MSRPARGLDGPFVSSLAVMAVLVAGGLAMLGLTWLGTSRHANVALQVPYIVSGGFAGLGLVGLCLGLLAIQSRRATEARRQAELGVVQRAARDLLDTVQ